MATVSVAIRLELGHALQIALSYKKMSLVQESNLKGVIEFYESDGEGNNTLAVAVPIIFLYLFAAQARSSRPGQRLQGCDRVMARETIATSFTSAK